MVLISLPPLLLYFKASVNSVLVSTPQCCWLATPRNLPSSPTAHMKAITTTLSMVGGGALVGVLAGAGVVAGAGAVGECLRLALMCQTTVTSAATRDKVGLSVDVNEDGAVAEGVVEGVVEPPLLCVGGGRRSAWSCGSWAWWSCCCGARSFGTWGAWSWTTTITGASTYNTWLRGLAGQPPEYAILKTMENIGYFDASSRKVVVPDANIADATSPPLSFPSLFSLLPLPLSLLPFPSLPSYGNELLLII